MKKAPKSGLRSSKPTFKLDLKVGLEGGGEPQSKCEH